MREWVDPCNNLLCADVHGNIAYLHRGQVPQRPMANAWLPVPGWTGEYEWQGHIPCRGPGCVIPTRAISLPPTTVFVGKDYPYYIAWTLPQNIAPAALWNAWRLCTTLPSPTWLQCMPSASPSRRRPMCNSSARCSLIDTWAARPRICCTTGTAPQNAIAPTLYSAFRLRLHQVIIEHLVGPVLAQEMFASAGRGAPGHLRQLTSQLVTMAAHNDTTWLPAGMDWSTLATRFGGHRGLASAAGR